MSGSLLLLPLALPLLLTARVDAGLVTRSSFAEVSSDPDVQTRLASVYATVEQVDLWTGGLCEDHVPGTLLGELFFALVRHQFELLRDGDRFYYERAFSGPALEALESTRLSDVIRRNTSIGAELSDDAFLGALVPFLENDFTVRAVTETGAVATGYTGYVLVSVSDGRDPLHGLLVEVTAADQGEVTVPRVAFFQSLGDLVISARTVPLARRPDRRANELRRRDRHVRPAARDQRGRPRARRLLHARLGHVLPARRERPHVHRDRRERQHRHGDLHGARRTRPRPARSTPRSRPPSRP